MKIINYYKYETPVGILTLGCIEEKIVICAFGEVAVNGHYQETKCLKEAYQQLNDYFLGRRKKFDLQYHFLTGTPFQQKVWRALLTIPNGQTASYQDIAKIVGSPKACRAIGGANHKNPIAIFIPCHRVIGTNGKLVGYGGGLDKKTYLLSLEKKYYTE